VHECQNIAPTKVYQNYYGKHRKPHSTAELSPWLTSKKIPRSPRIPEVTVLQHRLHPLAITLLMLCAAPAWAEPEPTSVRVENLRLLPAAPEARLVSFDLAWEESWRGPSRPSWVEASDNWDAAWVFMKYRVAGGTWHHATLAVDGHVTPENASLEVSTDRIGAFIYRSQSGYGAFHAPGIELAWDTATDGVPADARIEVIPFAIAMVFVPQGPFSVGSGATRSGEFRTGGTNATPFEVTSRSPLTLGDTAGQLMWTPEDLTGTPSEATSADFPTGYGAFYVMKHPLTQGEYSNFLNTLTATQAEARANNSSGFRYTIGDHNLNAFTTTTPHVAMNAMSWADGEAFADWAGLRPMTELEFEKVARGPLTPVANEFAWGSTSITQATAIAEAGTNLETPTPALANAVYGDAPGVQGPVRVGALAQPGRSRTEAGAGYYGALDLSGNLWERPVTIGNAAGRAFNGAHGDGSLSADGLANVPTWPGPEGVGAGFRGGSWNYSDDRLQVSNRSSAAHANPIRGNSIGWRGARTGP